MPTEGEALNGDIPHQEEADKVDEQRKQQQQHHLHHEQVRKNQHSCPQCGLLINSAASLQVHMQYQHEEMNRWGVPSSVQQSTASSSSTTSLTAAASSNGAAGATSGGSTSGTNLPSVSPTDSENNNQPASKQTQQYSAIEKPNLNSVNNATISAAADSSDNQSTTPQPQHSVASGIPSSGGSGHGSLESYNNSSVPYQGVGGGLHPPDMHPYAGYMPSYDQFYHPPPNMDYGQSALYASSQPAVVAPPNSEYKLVPSSRYHPYISNNSHQQHHQQQQHHHHATSNGNATNNASSTASNSSLSPRVVSSSSPTQNAIIGQTPQESAAMQTGQPTPSPSPKQCDKCGMVCQTHAQLNEHYTTAHGIQPPTHESAINRGGSGEDQDMQGQYSYQPYIKEEPSSDILDLDSQKMVYPPQHEPINQEPLPPMHSMHPMHRPLMWASPEMHSGYMTHPQSEMKPAYYSPLKQNYPVIKQEFPSGPSGFPAQMIKSEFNAHHQQQQPRGGDIKPFGADLPSGGNPVTSSPSEFPSTTTPQDNGTQFRNFEPPTSSLPSNTGSTKSASWKSNEARRPKTYNCTACNKWFTSSGHLKRHYNTTLHKNAVKSSGQPDPATMPISAHHHPSRDPNSKHHHRNNQANQPPPAPPEPPRSPEYNPQYTPPPNSFSQPPQGFQQYTTLHSSANGHPNGQAGPSVHASQQRGLLIISNTAATSTNQEEREVQHLQHQQEVPYTNLQQQQQQILEEQQLHHQQQLQLQVSNINNSLDLQHQHHSPDQVHIISMSPQHQQHMLQPLQQQQRQLEEQAIISTMDTTPTTTTTIINTMDQQYIITSPLPINTNITQSYQHLQLPEEHQLNYHTIIGNESDDLGSSSSASGELMELTTYGMDGDQQHQHEIVSVQRLPNGLVTYQDTISLPYSPVVPGFYATQIKCERSPEAGDIAPVMSPYSPTITSTDTVIVSPPNNAKRGSQTATTAKAAAAAKRRKLQLQKKQDLILSSATMTQIPPGVADSQHAPGSPTGEIRCDECNKVFTKICYLTQHNKTFHNGEQPFRCNRCGKRFSTESVYEVHYAKHSAVEKPHRCTYCPKQFHHKTDLRRHLDSHTGHKAYVCSTCMKGFTRRDHLRKHGDTHKPKPPKPAKTRTKSAAYEKASIPTTIVQFD